MPFLHTHPMMSYVAPSTNFGEVNPQEFSQDPLGLELVLTFFAVVFHYWSANL
jgi:hypothetical protein